MCFAWFTSKEWIKEKPLQQGKEFSQKKKIITARENSHDKRKLLLPKKILATGENSHNRRKFLEQEKILGTGSNSNDNSNAQYL